MPSFSICHVVSELAPFAKTGGLADASAGLCRYLGSQGHDVRIFVPLYGRVRKGGYELRPSAELADLDLPLGRRTYRAAVRTTPLPGSEGAVQVYFVDCPALFDREALYSADADEPVRFALLARAAVESCQRMAWAPDVFHLNDWHTGLLPLYLATDYAWDRLFAASRTLMVIHNIAYQGVFPLRVLADLNLAGERHLLAREDVAAGSINFLRTGLLHADRLATVSRTYAEEIRTAEYGMGLETLLERRRDVLTGIVNGVDYGEWDPAVDPYIERNYTAGDLEGKAAVKQRLLAEFGLDAGPGVPLFGIVSRLTSQKGLELLRTILPPRLERNELRLVALGSGEAELEAWFQKLRDAFPTRVGIYRGFDEALAHRIEAGADCFLMPSRYEPCGLNQMYSLKYGTVPVVRRTGGLADTVEPFEPSTGEGTGFVFDTFAPQALDAAISRALEVWQSPEDWRRLVRNGMSRDFSWQRQGPEYEALYAEMIASSVSSSESKEERPARG